MLEHLGRKTVEAVEEAGYLVALFVESLFWIFFGPFYRQPVRVPSVFSQMIQIGIAAVPRVFILSFAIGVMLAIQGIHTLKTFGAETQVVMGIAFSVTREFGPLITSILIAHHIPQSITCKYQKLIRFFHRTTRNIRTMRNILLVS